MRMTTKLVSLLTILFVFFKFGEPANVMMSIYGDKGFLFRSETLTTTDIVGFVYEDNNGAFAVANCTDTGVTPFTLKTDCTVVVDADITLTASGTAATAADVAAVKQETVSSFPSSSLSTNIMVSKPSEPPIVITTTTKLTDGSTVVATISNTVGTNSNAAAASNFLCNHLSTTTSNNIFAEDTSTSNFGGVKGVSGQTDNYLPIMKCVAVLEDSATASDVQKTALGSFVVIVTDHTDLTGYINTIAFSSVVLFPQSTKLPTNTSSVVGYINGIDKCPTGNNVTFTPSSTSATSCKGTISINTNGNYSFSYNGTAYYLPVTDASGATTCPATTTTTCEDFAFNFKYSNTLIGMLLIFMLKMLQSY